MLADPLLQYVHQPIQYSITTDNIKFADISIVRCEYGDQSSVVHQMGSIPFDLVFEHTYHQIGVYQTTCYLYIKDGTILINQATVQIIDQTSCHSIGNLQCDMDTDQIPDLCDDDIDGDGVYNML